MTELGQMNISSVTTFKKRAEVIYDENLSAYVKLVLRRPFAKIIVSVITVLHDPALTLGLPGLLRGRRTFIETHCAYGGIEDKHT